MSVNLLRKACRSGSALALASFASACIEFALFPTNPDEGCGFFCQPTLFRQDDLNLLVGDTLWVAALVTGPDVPRWSLEGDAAAIVGPWDPVRREINQASNTVVLKGAKHGAVTLRAQFGDTALLALPLFVADSTEMVAVSFGNLSAPSVRTGQQVHLMPTLSDAAGNSYGAKMSWTSSDSTVVDFQPPPFGKGIVARTQRQGTATVTADFLGVRGSLVITVVP